MKREEKKKILSTKSKIIFAFVLGIALSGTGVYAAVQYMANEVSFTSNTGLTSTNVQDAIDEVNETKYGYCPNNKNNSTSTKLCRRAVTLHTEKCTDSDGCGYNYGENDIIIYGNCGTSTGHGGIGLTQE